MWNSCESHIPLNGCKGTNFSAHFQIFLSFSFSTIQKSTFPPLPAGKMPGMRLLHLTGHFITEAPRHS